MMVPHSCLPSVFVFFLFLVTPSSCQSPSNSSSFLGGIPSSVSGNVDVYGSGYGDVYAGKVGEGVYGAGGRLVGDIGVGGRAGLGRRRRQSPFSIQSSGADSASVAGSQTPNTFSLAGSTAGSGSLYLGPSSGQETPSTAAPTTLPTTTVSTTAKPPTTAAADGPWFNHNSFPTWAQRRKRQSPSSTYSPLSTEPGYLPPAALFRPAIPSGASGSFATGSFHFEGVGVVDEEGEVVITGAKVINGTTGTF